MKIKPTMSEWMRSVHHHAFCDANGYIWHEVFLWMPRRTRRGKWIWLQQAYMGVLFVDEPIPWHHRKHPQQESKPVVRYHYHSQRDHAIYKLKYL